ncbi:hypothetical protein BC829DRAFT_255086 [Chytridium lagenaria]|nr:hypothetical protein BC829DRAFT_255086 [Chytridium lagenaria]
MITAGGVVIPLPLNEFRPPPVPALPGTVKFGVDPPTPTPTSLATHSTLPLFAIPKSAAANCEASIAGDGNNLGTSRCPPLPVPNPCLDDSLAEQQPAQKVSTIHSSPQLPSTLQPPKHWEQAVEALHARYVRCYDQNDGGWIQQVEQEVHPPQAEIPTLIEHDTCATSTFTVRKVTSRRRGHNNTRHLLTSLKGHKPPMICPPNCIRRPSDDDKSDGEDTGLMETG